MEKKRKVSIIVPVYNAEKTIKRCIESLINQTYTNIEIILVNDGSKDNSLEICKQFEQEKITIIDKKNEGVSITRNTGISNANGDYIAFVDSDDYVKENYISEMVKAMESQNVDWVICNYDVITKNQTKPNKPLETIAKCNARDIDKYLFEIYSRTLLNQPWNKLYKKEFIQAEFEPKMSLGEDLIFNLEYIKRINALSYINEYLYNYDIETSSTLHKKKQNIEDFLFLYENLYAYIKNNQTTEIKKWNQFFIRHYIRFLCDQNEDKQQFNNIYTPIKRFSQKMDIKKVCSKTYLYMTLKMYQIMREKRKK